MQATKEVLFPLGQVLATPGALMALEKAKQHPHEFLLRHVHGEWGNVPPEDWQENQTASNPASGC